jgi:predicted transcriptional regulator
MSIFTIELSDERLEKLRELAAQLGSSPEELVRASIEGLLNGPDDEFKNAAQYVLEKNSELYRRLGEQA